MAAGLRMANIDLNKPQDIWNYAIWTDETQAEMFVHKTQHIWCISAQTPQNICKAWQKKGNDLGLFCSQWINHWLLCILNWVMQKVNDPKHSSKPSTGWLKKEAWCCNGPVKAHISRVCKNKWWKRQRKALHQDPAGRLMSHRVSLVSGPSMESKNFFLKPERTCWSKVFNQIWTPLFSQLKD